MNCSLFYEIYNDYLKASYSLDEPKTSERNDESIVSLSVYSLDAILRIAVSIDLIKYLYVINVHLIHLSGDLICDNNNKTFR